MIYGAILAGGIGRRMERQSIPKQFITIGGTPILVLTMRQMLANRRLDAIYVAVHKDWLAYTRRLFQSSFRADENSRIVLVEGGKERLDSFVNIMNAIIRDRGMHDEDILICHDSVRPFVRQQMLDDCIDATLADKIALTVVPVADTIHSASAGDYLDGTLDRNGLYRGQTPSGFNLRLLHDACGRVSDEEKAAFTGTTQLMLKLGYRIRIVKGHTSNFKITTDNDLDVAERMLHAEAKPHGIELVDCTLRDGGIVVNFDFGTERMQAIQACLEASHVEYIECGYIDERKGSREGRTCFCDEKAIAHFLLSTGKSRHVTYLAMIDYGTFDVSKLGERTAQGIDGIRLAFHKEHWPQAIACGKEILSKGYQLYIQPMVSMRYSDAEYRELIEACNRDLAGASGFYVVDSFGQMDNLSLTHKLEITDQAVSPSMKLGFHAHNNRQLAFSNACAFLQYPLRHAAMLDSTIMGMGKGAGNLCTELIAPVLNERGKSYNLNGIYEQISTYFSQQLKQTPWGYSLDYYLASLYGCTPSYIKLFTADRRVTTDILIELLQNMPEEKKAACDKAFAAEYLRRAFEG
ncbi:MAG: D-ribitol-5-phosphate cytidylyltransferase [Firmicutes bacterium]|nr:D-ribitol-5-phosphate cytidylyltransferase [Bacillota bacterium]